jgi:AGZA family xanthine/uracil permease-like MFS transporter
MPPSLAPVFLQLDIAGALQLSMVTPILSMLIVDIFDTAGTLVGVATRANLLGDDGKLPRLRRALLSDSSATVVGALAGTSSTTSYIESAAGVEAGGRTGLTAVVCGLLFLACLFFAPLAQSVPAFATASALLFVACLMARSLADLDWHDITESAPAVVAAIAMPLSFSIAEGIGLGFISYVLIKIVSGRAQDCSIASYVIALIFGLKYAFL